MKNTETDLWKPRNPITQRQTRQQVLRQITIPVIVAVVILLVLIFLAVTALSPAGHRVWADIALIWMISPAILFTLIMTVITGGSAYLVIKLISALPPLFYKIQNYARLFNVKTKQVGDKVIGPFVKVSSLRASARAGRHAVRSATRRVMNRE